MFYSRDGAEDPTFGNFNSVDDYVKALACVKDYPQVRCCCRIERIGVFKAHLRLAYVCYLGTASYSAGICPCGLPSENRVAPPFRASSCAHVTQRSPTVRPPPPPSH